MGTPISVDIPHRLGRETARERIAGGVGRLGDKIPGGVAELTSSWNEDRMRFAFTAMGQAVEGTIDVADDVVRLTVDLPGMLGLFADPVRAAIEKAGPKLLA